MDLASLTYFICAADLPFLSACHKHTSQSVYIDLKYLHHYLIEHGGLSRKTKLYDWVQRYFRFAVDGGVPADALHVASKRNGYLNAHVTEVSAFIASLVYRVCCTRKAKTSIASIHALWRILRTILSGLSADEVIWEDVIGISIIGARLGLSAADYVSGWLELVSATGGVCYWGTNVAQFRSRRLLRYSPYDPIVCVSNHGHSCIRVLRAFNVSAKKH